MVTFFLLFLFLIYFALKVDFKGPNKKLLIWISFAKMIMQHCGHGSKVCEISYYFVAVAQQLKTIWRKKVSFEKIVIRYLQYVSFFLFSKIIGHKTNLRKMSFLVYFKLFSITKHIANHFWNRVNWRRTFSGMLKDCFNCNSFR